MKRRGFTLIELIFVVGVVGILLAMISPLFNDLLRNVPRSARALETHRQTGRFVDALRADVERGIFLPATSRGFSAADAPEIVAGEDAILIGDGERLIAWMRTSDGWIRTGISPEEPVAPDTFILPDVGVDTRIVRRGGVAVALEVKTWALHQRGEAVSRRLQRTDVLFLGLRAEGGKP